MPQERVQVAEAAACSDGKAAAVQIARLEAGLAAAQAAAQAVRRQAAAAARSSETAVLSDTTGRQQQAAEAKRLQQECAALTVRKGRLISNLIAPQCITPRGGMCLASSVTSA